MPKLALDPYTGGDELNEFGKPRIHTRAPDDRIADVLVHQIMQAEPMNVRQFVTHRSQAEVRRNVHAVLLSIGKSGAARSGMRTEVRSEAEWSRFVGGELMLRSLHHRVLEGTAEGFLQACRAHTEHHELRDIIEWGLCAYGRSLVDIDAVGKDVRTTIQTHRPDAAAEIQAELYRRLEEALARFVAECTDAESLQLMKARRHLTHVTDDLGYFRLLRRFLSRRQFAELELETLSRGQCREVGGAGKTIESAQEEHLAGIIGASFGPSRVPAFLRELRSGQLRMHYHTLEGVGPACCAGEFIVNDQWGCLDWLGQRPEAGGTVKALRVLNARTSPRRLFSTCNWRSLPVQVELLNAVGSTVDRESYALPYIRTLVLQHAELSRCPAKQEQHAVAVQTAVDTAKSHPFVQQQIQLADQPHIVVHLRLTPDEMTRDAEAKQRGESFYMGQCLYETIDTLQRQHPHLAIVRCIPEGDCHFPGPQALTVIFGPNPVSKQTNEACTQARREYASMMDTIHGTGH